MSKDYNCSKELEKEINKSLKERVKDEVDKEVNIIRRRSLIVAREEWPSDAKPEGTGCQMIGLQVDGNLSVILENVKGELDEVNLPVTKREMLEANLPPVPSQLNVKPRKSSANTCKGYPVVTKTMLMEINPQRYLMLSKNSHTALQQYNCVHPPPPLAVAAVCQAREEVLIEELEVVEIKKEISKCEINKDERNRFNFCDPLDNEIVLLYANSRHNEILNDIKLAIEGETSQVTKEMVPVVTLKGLEVSTGLLQSLLKPFKTIPRLFLTQDGREMIKQSKLTKEIRARMRRRAEKKRKDVIPDSSDEN